MKIEAEIVPCPGWSDLSLPGFLPMIPAADSSLAAVVWFDVLLVGGIDRGIVTLTFVAGLASMLTFIDGVAWLSKFRTTFQTTRGLQP